PSPPPRRSPLRDEPGQPRPRPPPDVPLASFAISRTAFDHTDVHEVQDHMTHNGDHEHHDGHGAAHGHDDHAAQFRERFWWSLLLAIPVGGFSEMFSALLGYRRPAGTAWISPVVGVVVFVYGGLPFLSGALEELRARQPGMMLLIGLAITVAFVASAVTSLG